MIKHEYDFKIDNGRVKVYVDGYVMFTFSQEDFKGYYAYKNQTSFYGITIYLMSKKSSHKMEILFEIKEDWLNILKILDTNL